MYITSKMNFILEKHSFMFLLVLAVIFREHPYIRTKTYIQHQHYLGHCLDANPLRFDGAASKLFSH
jgi:hypothetical protein